MSISKLIGKPYKHCGRGPDEFDCFGLITYCYKEFLGIYLPDYKNYGRAWYRKCNVLSDQLNKFSKLWVSVKNPKKWDIMTYSLGVAKITNHCSLYLGENKMIHCYENSPVVIDRVNRPYWKNNLTGVIRYVGLN